MSLTIKGRPIHFSLKWLKHRLPDGTMTLFEHLRELRYRLVVAVLAILAGMIVAWFFRYQLLDILQRPYFQAIADLKAKNPDADTSLVNINLTSPLTLSLKVSALAEAIVTAPIWLYQLWAFIVPGLLAKEKKWALVFIGVATPVFIGGGCWLCRLAQGHHGAAQLHAGSVTNLQDINAYLSFLMRLMLVFGIAFLIPLVVLLLNIVEVVKAKTLSKYRTLVIFGTFVFGAIARLDRSVFHARPCRTDDAVVPGS